MIKFENVSKIYRTDFWTPKFAALNDFSFNLSEGDLVGFLGANGAGKTTSIKILMNFIRATGGRVSFDKRLGANFRTILSQIGYLPEQPYFYPYLTGEEFIQYMGELQNLNRSVIKERLSFWSNRFQIEHAITRKIRSYSKGMQQRVGFISAVIHEPQILILDEPLSGLDPVGRKEIKDVMLELHKQGKTVFFSSHIVSDVEEICNKVVVLERGKLFYEGSVEKLINQHMNSKYLIDVEAISRDKISAVGVDVGIGGEGRTRFLVDYDKKDELINEIVALGGGRILGVNQNRPTLEEIVYKAKKKG